MSEAKLERELEKTKTDLRKVEKKLQDKTAFVDKIIKEVKGADKVPEAQLLNKIKQLISESNKRANERDKAISEKEKIKDTLQQKEKRIKELEKQLKPGKEKGVTKTERASKQDITANDAAITQSVIEELAEIIQYSGPVSKDDLFKCIKKIAKDNRLMRLRLNDKESCSRNTSADRTEQGEDNIQKCFECLNTLQKLAEWVNFPLNDIGKEDCNIRLLQIVRETLLSNGVCVKKPEETNESKKQSSEDEHKHNSKKGCSEDGQRWSERLQAASQRNEELSLENKDLRQTLEEFNTMWGKHLSQGASSDDSNRENLSVVWRPMKIADTYKTLGNTYDTAHILKETGCSDEEERVANITCHVLLVCSDVIRHYYEEFLQTFHNLIIDPVGYGNKDRARPPTIPQDQMKHQEEALVQLLESYYKSHWSVDLQKPIQDICIQLQEESKRRWHVDPMVFESPLMTDFLNASCELSWRMALQKPPMTFSVEGIGDPYNSENQFAAYSCECNPEAPGAVVKYYILPTLKHQNHVHERGVVHVGRKK